MTYARTDLEYSYEPRDFYEAEVVVDTDIGRLTAVDGTLIVTLPTPRTPFDRKEAATITESVRAIMRARQVLVHRPFTLSGPNVIHYRPNGRRDIVMFAETAKIEIKGVPVDILVTDRSGKVVTSTRADRIAEHSRRLSKGLRKQFLDHPYCGQCLRVTAAQ